MISKKELLDALSEIQQKGYRVHQWNEVMSWAESLPDDQPDLLPFQWPIPQGMEVVTRDGRKVVKIGFWEMLDMPVLFAVEEYSEPFTALPDGRTCLSRQSDLDLFLRRVEKKVWVVEHKDGVTLTAMPYNQKDLVDKWLDNNQKANLYEATLS